MSRNDEFKQNAVNPAELRITWKSADKSFVSYNTTTKIKETLANVKFAVLYQTVSIAGFSESQNLGIFSNEIKDIKGEVLTVRTKNGVLLEGCFDSIKEKLASVGASFANNLYVQLGTGELAVIQLSSSALKSWFDYKTANSKKLVSNWVVVSGVEDHKKGAVKYSTPVLTIGDILTSQENQSAEINYAKVVEYRNSFKPLELEIPSTIQDEPDFKDLPY